LQIVLAFCTPLTVILYIQQQLLQSSVDVATTNAKSFDCTSPSAFVSILPLLSTTLLPLLLSLLAVR
jgi:hypothetical protein